MAIPCATADSWDCHVHSFDPDRFPYKNFRAYTPRPAPMDDLLKNLITQNVMLVQATIEKSFEDLLEKLKECRSSTLGFPGIVRGTILAGNALSILPNNDFEQMHLLGVRCIRLHGSYGGSGHDIEWVQGQLQDMAQLHPVLEYGWSISAQLPLRIWSGLKSCILTDQRLARVTIIADHIACATPVDIGSPELADFLDLLRSGRVYVKISALHRRNPTDIEAMEPIVKLLAQAAPHALLWGSDWPHVNTSHNDYEEGPLDGVEATHELDFLKRWLSKEQVQQMLVGNPQRLFAG